MQVLFIFSREYRRHALARFAAHGRGDGLSMGAAHIVSGLKALLAATGTAFTCAVDSYHPCKFSTGTL